MIKDIIYFGHEFVVNCGFVNRVSEASVLLNMLLYFVDGRYSRKNPLSSSIIGVVEADEQGLKIKMIGNIRAFPYHSGSYPC